MTMIFKQFDQNIERLDKLNRKNYEIQHFGIKISKIKSFILFLNINIIVIKISIHIIIKKSIDNSYRETNQN
jgi:hypothetical protein